MQREIENRKRETGRHAADDVVEFLGRNDMTNAAENIDLKRRALGLGSGVVGRAFFERLKQETGQNFGEGDIEEKLGPARGEVLKRRGLTEPLQSGIYLYDPVTGKALRRLR